MSILSVDPMGLKGGSRGGMAQYVVTHRVVCSANPTIDTIFNVAAAMKLLGFYDGAALTSDPRCTCSDIDIQIDRGAVKVSANGGTGLFHWTVQSTFSSQPSQDPASNKQDNPTLRPPKFNIRQSHYTAPAIRDVLFDPVRNSATDPLRREEPRARLQITIDKTVATFDPTLCLDARKRTSGSNPPGFLFSRNLNAWSPFGIYSSLFNNFEVSPGHGLMHDLSFGVTFENNQPFVELHAEILVDDDRHQDRCWDEGYRVYEVSEEAAFGYVLVPYQDPITGAYPSSPIPLDGSGMALAAGSPLHELTFQYFPTKDWSALPIP